MKKIKENELQMYFDWREALCYVIPFFFVSFFWIAVQSTNLTLTFIQLVQSYIDFIVQVVVCYFIYRMTRDFFYKVLKKEELIDAEIRNDTDLVKFHKK